MGQDRTYFEKMDKVLPIAENPTEWGKFQQWANNRWYLKFESDKIIVTKGRTHKQFKFIKYDTADLLIGDIEYYMSCDYCQWRTKR